MLLDWHSTQIRTGPQGYLHRATNVREIVQLVFVCLFSILFIVSQLAHRFVFLNFDPQNEWRLRDNAVKASDELIKYIRNRVQKISGEGSMVCPRHLTRTVGASSFYSAVLSPGHQR